MCNANVKVNEDVLSEWYIGKSIQFFQVAMLTSTPVLDT